MKAAANEFSKAMRNNHGEKNIIWNHETSLNSVLVTLSQYQQICANNSLVYLSAANNLDTLNNVFHDSQHGLGSAAAS